MWIPPLSNRLTFRVLGILILTFCLSACTDNRKTVTNIVFPDDENRVFELVAAPGAEGRYADAIAAADSILTNCEMSDTLRAYIMIERDVALFNSGDIMAATAYADTLSSFGRKAGINEAVMQGEQIKGGAFRRCEQYDSALTCYTRALDAAMSDGNIEMEQTIAESIAILYTETSRTAEALGFARRSLKLAEELADTTAILSAVSTIGAIQTRDNLFREAITTLSPYTALATQAAAPYTIKFLTPLFRSYLSLDSIDKARLTVTQMEQAVAGLPEYHQSYTVMLSAKAALLGREERYPEQWKVYCRIDSLGTHGKTAENILLERAQCLAGMKDYAKAYDKMREAYAVLDSTRHVDIETQLSDLSVRYDTLNKEIEIERLSRQHWVLVSVALLCVMLLGIVVIIAVSTRRRHLRHLAQEKQQEYIRGLEQERGRMARELHDDIAGDLVGLQYELPTLSHEAGAERVREIAGRVRRLSHELMPPQFSTQSLTALLLDYVRGHNLSSPSPKLTITDEGSFDWSSLTPEQSYELYRIVQEAVSNAIRHSSARTIAITLDGSDRFILSVSNDGVTASATSSSDPDGIGARTIRTRAEIIGAKAETSLSGDTFTITISQL